MLFAPITRNELLHFLPKDGVAAEVGVLDGKFSAEILKRSGPKALHLIDPWTHQDRADYQRDPANAVETVQEDRYRNVCARFAGEVEAGRVTIHRAFSVEAAATFPDGTFDWVYIDAVHSFAGVLADLEAFAPKVKPDGLILGDDFTNHSSARAMQFGVVEAFEGFTRRHGYELIALTRDIYPAVVIARSACATAAAALTAGLVYHVPGVVEVREPFASGFLHKEMRFPDGTVRYYPSF